MIEKAKEKLTGHAEQPRLPLIRLRLLYSDENQMFNHIRFGQRFNTRVRCTGIGVMPVHAI